MNENTKSVLDILGIGIGPFNLSLAALLSESQKLKSRFIDRQSEFTWHRELMFPDATMQTCYLKDLVSPVNPTNPCSFMNYLVTHGLFYHFLNTDRKTVTRMEFQAYCQWVCSRLGEQLSFNDSVQAVRFEKDHFIVETQKQQYQSKNICIGSGPVKNIPKAAQACLSGNVFHVKSPEFQSMQLEGKRVLIVGAGQTGIELFSNMLKGHWGRIASASIISHRQTLQPLDEAPFTNEFFSPGYVQEFLNVNQKIKDQVVESQRLSSDGNTPSYLVQLYQELYLDKFYLKQYAPYSIRPMRWLEQIQKVDQHYHVICKNMLFDQPEVLDVDIIILATGFKTTVPDYIRDLYSELSLDGSERPVINFDYSLSTKLPRANKIYAMNFSRHFHGIADPQTSLMAWRSAVIANSLLGDEKYRTKAINANFCQYGVITDEGVSL